MTDQPKVVALERFDAMRYAIIAAHDVDEVLEIRNKAVALEAYCRVAQDPEPERLANAIRLRAERRAGELLKKMEKAQGKRTDLVTADDQVDGGKTTLDGQRAVPSNSTPTLSDMGITKNQSSTWQQLANVPEDEFEEAVSNPTTKPSTSGIIRHHRQRTNPESSVEPMDPDILWLWGRLQDFERNIIHRDAMALASAMEGHTKETIKRLAPVVAQWLLTLEEKIE